MGVFFLKFEMAIGVSLIDLVAFSCMIYYIFFGFLIFIISNPFTFIFIFRMDKIKNNTYESERLIFIKSL